MDFKDELNNMQEIVNCELEKYVRREKCPEEILNESMAYSLISSAKRLRPILIISSYKLFKDDYKVALPFAVAMEMIHNFSLIHDDLPIIDNDDFRHGKPTNHKQFNDATALLAGDGLLNSAYMVISNDLLDTKDQDMRDRKIRAFKEFSHAIDRMIAGEYVDTEFEGKDISNEYLEYMHNNKTGALIKCSVKMGGIIAGASEEEIAKLISYSDKIGLAFQIKDDILSEIGDEKILGKPVGNDRLLGKVTFVTKYGLEKAKEILDTTVNEGIRNLEYYGEKADFLRELALYIKNRNK